AADEQALAHDLADAVTGMPRDEVADDERQRQEGQADHQARPADPEQLPKALARALGSMTEKLPDRIAQDRRFFRQAGWTIEMDEKRERRVGRNVPRPRHDEFLGIGIEILLTERRRIDRIEQLPQFRDMDLDDFARLRDGVTCRRRRLRHAEGYHAAAGSPEWSVFDESGPTDQPRSHEATKARSYQVFLRVFVSSWRPAAVLIQRGRSTSVCSPILTVCRRFRKTNVEAMRGPRLVHVGRRK